MFIGAVAVLIGLIAFTLSWNMWEFWQGPLPGYQFFLFPGNLTLIYVWHPLFTEEVNFWPKLFMLIFGQFIVTSSCCEILFRVIHKLMDVKVK